VEECQVEEITLTAVSTRVASASSTLPPGRAVWPACVRSALERVVRRTRSWPASS
jgi:hypothetical protein